MSAAGTSDEYRSPLLELDGAVAATGVDSPVAWHYGDPLGEQRRARDAAGLFDQSHRDVLGVSGPDRLEWLHAICSQHLSELRDGESTQALVLSMHGHVEQHWVLTELDDRIWIDTEPGRGPEVLAYLDRMKFLKRVENRLITADWAQLSLIGPGSIGVLNASGLSPAGFDGLPAGAIRLPGGGLVRQRSAAQVDLLVPRAEIGRIAAALVSAGATPMGTWAAQALRIERHEPRLGLDTDHRTLAHEVGWIGKAVHLDKGCYRGQETVARVQNMGRPPRRLVLLHLGGESDLLPPPGSAVEKDGKAVGVLGSAAHHHELGPVALALVKRSAGPGEALSVAGHSAAVDRADEPGTELVTGFAGHTR